MQKYIFITMLFLLSNSNFMYGQTLLNSNQTVIYNNIHQEKIFVHFNASLLFSGDYLYYKVYNINSQTKKLSQLSKIAYVELIGKDKGIVFKHKVKLRNGTGQSDFFIPTSIASGNYKLIAYTQWMRNVGNNYYFQADVCIINPFMENQGAIAVKPSDSIADRGPSNQNKIDKSLSKYVELKVNAKTFSKREKVILQINALMDEDSFGNYSISARKIDSISIPHRPHSNSYQNNYSQPQLKSKNQLIHLPELRGELLSGTVLEKSTAKKIPVKNISLSISGKNPVFKSSVTNNSGVFYFNLDEPYETPTADLHVIDDNLEKYEITINQDTPLSYEALTFSNFKISPEMKELIIDRSVNNQIENAYSNAKQHKIRLEKPATSFYSGQGIIYNLDDFTRFKTVKETVVEIVNGVWIEKRNDIDNFKINIDQPTIKGLPPLIIVDGLLVLNHDDLINYDSRKIKKISVVNNRYKYGGSIFEGVLFVETINGDFKNSVSKNYTKSILLVRPQDNKNYFNQIYNGNESLKHIPDYRSQLYWEPNFNLNQKENTVTFYTSDYVGNYEINIEGFTNDGLPVSLKGVISVK